MFAKTKFAVMAAALSLLWTGPAAANAGLFTPAQLEPVAKVAIGAVLTWVLEAPVSVEGVHWRPGGQFLELTGLRIGNPLGFSGPYALAADSIRIEADPKQLLSPNPEIHLIQVTGVTINAEFRLLGGFNFKRLMDNAGRIKFGGLGIIHPPGAGKLFHIEKGVLDGAKINVSVTRLGKRSVYHKTIGRIEMSFGAAGAGVPADQAMAQFLRQLIQELDLTNGISGARSHAKKSHHH